jgi:hypothetical protein
VTPLAVLGVLSPFLVATHAGLEGVVIEMVLALLVVGMHDGDVVVQMAVSAVLFFFVVPIFMVTSHAVILQPGTVGRMIEDDESPLAIVHDADRFLGRRLCIVVVEGENAYDQACDEKKKGDSVRPGLGLSHGSFLAAAFRLQEMQEAVRKYPSPRLSW